jgi:pyruvate,water dikinase
VNLSELRAFDQIEPGSAAAVGGKGLSLALMARCGLPVPPGFCVTTAAYRRLSAQGPHADPAFTGQLGACLRNLGDGPVAVRSSATVEDGAVTSFAGQQETILGVTGEAAVLDAIARCWASLDSDRARAYRRHQGISDAGLGMAVVVQQLVPAEVSGVLFTRDPLDPQGRRMLVEACWGLGESVVSGRLTPDRYHLDRDTGAVLEQVVAVKPTMHTISGPQPVPPERQNVPCLTLDQLAQLAELGRRVEALYGDARDIEWAWADGRCWLLQARPITTGGAAEREQVRQEEIVALAARADPAGTVWSRYNLAEVLPEPTPMTWAVIRRLLSGRGGYGLMYRDLGFNPDPSLDDGGIFDLVCGRPYCNLSREPRMQFRDLPFEHPFAVLKANPRKALYPQPILNPARAGWRFWLLLPIITIRLIRSAALLKRLGQTFPRHFREDILPAFRAAVREEAGQDLTRLDDAALLERLERVIRLSLVDFARDSLKPTVLAAVALVNLERVLIRALGPDRGRAVLGELAAGARPDPEADLPAAVRAVQAGQKDRRQFLEEFGHRGHQEMELAQPRWGEDPAALDGLFGAVSRPAGSGDVNRTEAEAAWQPIVAEAKVPPSRQADLRTELELLHMHLGLRETAKHHLMEGYAVVRRILVELDRRYRLDGGIFFLLPEELPRLTAGEDLAALVRQRRRRRQVALSLEVPAVLFSDSLDAIGRTIPIEGADDTWQGTPLSAGVAEGLALVLREPTGAAPPDEPYILVCPSTDPAWVPLFTHARGLVMETGGVLSHGAIVAREFGLPAVAGLPGVQDRLRTGLRLRVDGGSGQITIIKTP